MTRMVAALLIILLTVARPLTASQNAAPGTLRVRVLQGQDAVHNTLFPRPVEIVIEVRDGADFPVENANVTFESPESGPGGSFPGGQPVLKTRTNYQGQAGARFVPNNVIGRFAVKVRVSTGALNAELLIPQSNSSHVTDSKRGRKISGWWWISLGAAAVAGVALGLVLTSGDAGSANAIVISPGGPTIVRPRGVGPGAL